MINVFGKVIRICVCLSVTLALVITPIRYKAGGEENIVTMAESRRSDTLNSYVEQMIDDKDLSGSMLVAYHDQILYKKGFGLANTAAQIENAPTTKYLIGSVTKSFTAMAIMQLYENHQLDIQDTIDKYLPDFPHSNEITIYHLLTHTSGLPSDISEIAKIVKLPSNMDEALSLVKGTNFPLLDEPGKAFHYSNTGYVLLGFIIEKLEGISYGQYIQEHIFDLLDMKDSGFGYDINVDNFATSYDIQGRPLIGTSSMDMSVWPQAAGGLYSTAEDLYKWDRALYGDSLVGKDYLKAIFTPYIGDQFGSGYGFGWGIYHTSSGIKSIQDRICIMHGGLYSGYGSSISRFPEENVCIIMLNNRNDTALSDQINADIIKILFKPEVYNHGSWMDFKNEPVFEGENLLLPADELAASLNAAYRWDETQKTATIVRGETEVEVKIGSPAAIVNQKSVELPTDVQMSNVPLIPAEFLCKTLGFHFEYDAHNCIAIIED